MTTKTIGQRFTYKGTRHPYLNDRDVVVVAVHVGALVDVDDVFIVTHDEDLPRKGINPARDLVEVAPLVNGRPSFATSDAMASELVGLL